MINLNSIIIRHKKSLVYTRRKFAQQWLLQLCALAGMIYLFVFNVLPMIGVMLSFNNFQAKLGLMGFFTSPWVGFKWFKEFLSDSAFWPIARNTILMSVYKLIFTFPSPILFALCLNEVMNIKLKRVVQTVSYLPYFLSWVVVQGLLVSFLNMQNGVINQVLISLGLTKTTIPFLSDPKYFYWVIVISDVWKGMGWWTIIFLAAIAGIDPTLYEAAVIDGAGRLNRIWNITLPSIQPTIVVVLVLALGSLLGGGLSGSNFEQSYLLGNTSNAVNSEILQTYTLKMGLSLGRYSYATAVSLMQSIISIILVLISNFTAKRISGTGLF